MRRKRKETYIFAPDRQPHRGRGALKWILTALFLIVAMILTLNYVNGQQVENLTQRITVEKLSRDLENFTILHISDLNGSQIGRDCAAVRKAVTGKNVSCVVFTGDMVGKGGDATQFLNVLDALPKDVTVVFIAGDSDPAALDATPHDSISPYSSWVEQATDRGAIYLDEPMALTRGKSTLWLVPEYLYTLDLDSMESAYTTQADGLRSSTLLLDADQAAQLRVAEYQLTKIASIREKFAAIKEEDVQVAVTHTPLTHEYVSTMMAWDDGGDLISYKLVSLILGGQYAAGQWRLPGLGAIYAPGMGWWPSDEGLVGLNYVGGIPQYISPGLGASDYYPLQPGRFMNAPAVTVLTLTSKVV